MNGLRLTGCSARRLLARRRGSLAIFFCLVLSAMILVFSILIQTARDKAVENDLNRALAAQVQTTLAAYDQKWQQFGLFGFLTDAPDRTVFAAALPKPLRACPLTIEPLAPLSDPAVLEGQVIRYMKGRLPAAYLEALLRLLADLRQTFADQPVAAGKDRPALAVTRQAAFRVAAGGAAVNPAGSFRDLLATILTSMDGPAIRNTADSLFGGLLNQLQDQALLKMQDLYRQYATEVLGTGSDNSQTRWLDQLPDFLDPGSISRLAGYLDQLLAFDTAPVYEKCCLTEYVLGQFCPLVLQINRLTGSEELRTLDGRLFRSLPASRAGEAELILTGLSGTGTAKLAVQALLVSLRGILHLAALLTDQSAMASLRAAAGGLTASIAALTAGTVIVDPEIMVYLLAAGRAIGEALSDCRRLLAGDGVNFWPGCTAVQITLYYQDYLRLFLLTIPRSTLMKRIAVRLSAILPGPCYTGLRVSTIYRERTMTQTGGYQPWAG